MFQVTSDYTWGITNLGARKRGKLNICKILGDSSRLENISLAEIDVSETEYVFCLCLLFEY